MKLSLRLILPSLLLFLSGCFFSTSAIEVSDVCALLDEKVRWYKAVDKSEKRWRVPKYLMLAFIHQESRFKSNAKPPRDSFFNLFRSSSAYGFGQVKDETWQWYQLKTGNSAADRDDFADVADFIGWYVTVASNRLGIAKSDVRNQYLAYHEGMGGFERKTYQQKPWLISVAQKVVTKAGLYKRQLRNCEDDLRKNEVWSFF